MRKTQLVFREKHPVYVLFLNKTEENHSNTRLIFIPGLLVLEVLPLLFQLCNFITCLTDATQSQNEILFLKRYYS